MDQKKPFGTLRVINITRFEGQKLDNRPIRKEQSPGRFVAGTRESCYAFLPLEYRGISIFFEG